jgi:hypothetical protein
MAPRGLTVTLVAAAVMVVVIVLLFVWPGFLVTTHCNPSTGSSESVAGRTYCAVTVPLPRSPTHYYANFSAWGFTFHLFVPPTPGFSGMTINVTEPNGAEYSGGMGIGGPPRSNFTNMWFTPDNESGVTVVWNSLNASLLVEKGY